MACQELRLGFSATPRAVGRRRPGVACSASRSLLRRLEQQLTSGERSALELTEAYLAAIEAAQPTLNAYSTVCAAAAREAAAATDARRAAGEALGPFAGIPVSVKVRVCA